MLNQPSEGLSELFRETARRVRAALLSLDLPRSAESPQPKSEIQASGSMSVIVAVKDSPEVLLRCLLSLEKYAPQSEVILVDDGSELRETLVMIESFQTRNGWIIARHEKPRGHSKSCETGARLATRAYLCLLNS